METGRYAAPIHGYGYTVGVSCAMLRWGIVRLGEARRFSSGWFW
jgi:hypothetical protein